MGNSNSEASLSFEPAIICQSNLGNPLKGGDPMENMIPKEFVKLFIARQKDLQLSKNIDLQLARFRQLILDQKESRLVLKE